MYFFGVLFIVLGGWLIDSGIEGRHPVATVEAIIEQGPKNWDKIKTRSDLMLGKAPAVDLSPGNVVKTVGKDAMSAANSVAPGGSALNFIPVVGPWLTTIGGWFK